MASEAPASEPCSSCGGVGSSIEDGTPWGCSHCNGSGFQEKLQERDIEHGTV